MSVQAENNSATVCDRLSGRCFQLLQNFSSPDIGSDASNHFEVMPTLLFMSRNSQVCRSSCRCLKSTVIGKRLFDFCRINLPRDRRVGYCGSAPRRSAFHPVSGPAFRSFVLREQTCAVVCPVFCAHEPAPVYRLAFLSRTRAWRARRQSTFLLPVVRPRPRFCLRYSGGRAHRLFGIWEINDACVRWEAAERFPRRPARAVFRLTPRVTRLQTGHLSINREHHDAHRPRDPHHRRL